MFKLLLVALLLVGCGEHQERHNMLNQEWDKAKIIDVETYQTKGNPRFLQTFEMDGYKFVIFNNGYGSAMQAIIPIDTTSKELDEYIHMLEEENQILGSKLAEYE
jgi:hypothetical protein|tara:strand:+ start:225 stop:539 length:315 start_codon:yes stop_codon:yes gene_type:complete